MCVGDVCSQSQPPTGFFPDGAIDLARRAEMCVTGRGGWKFENKLGIALARRSFAVAGDGYCAMTSLWRGMQEL